MPEPLALPVDLIDGNASIKGCDLHRFIRASGKLSLCT
jgi:hypothetical protein